MIGNTDWPHLLADITAKRDALNQVIETLTTHFIREVIAEMPESPVVRPGRIERNHRPRKVGRPKKLAAKRNERTNEPRQRAVRSRPDDDQQNAILAALREKSPQSPSQLAKTLRISRPVITYRLKPLLKSGAVIATGATMNRQISLAGKARPKEVP